MSARDRAIKQQLRESQAIQAMHFGALEERERIIKLLDQFWCQEIACSKHPVRMDWVIAAIKEENK